MSGGSYDYAYQRVADVADEIRLTSCCSEYVSVKLRQAFKAHLKKVAAAMKAIEWNDSCDGDDKDREKILACVGPNILESAIQVAIDAKKAAEDAAAELGKAIDGAKNSAKPG